MGIRLRKVARRAWLTALAVIVGLVLVIASGLTFLIGTETGRLTALAQAERWLPVLTGQTLDIDNPSWATLDELRFDRLGYQAGDGGLRVDVEGGVFRWQPQYAWQRRVWIDALTAERVSVDVPASTETQTPPEAASSTDPLGQLQAIWGRIPPIQLAQLSVAEFELLLPDRAALRTAIDADAEINWGSWPARLSLALTEGENQSVNLSVAVEAANALSVRGDLEAAASASWAQWIDWPLEESLQGEWDVSLSRVETQWRADIARIELPWREHRLGLTGQISYSPVDTRLYLTPLNADIDGQPARFNGFVGPGDANLDIQADALPLALLNGLIPVEDLSGDISVAGQLIGGWQQPQYQGGISLNGALRGDPLSVNTQSRATINGVDIDSAQLRWGEARLDTRGSVEWGSQQLDMSVSWEALDQSRWQPWVAAWPAELTLTTSGEGSLAGGFDSPQFEGRIETAGSYQQASFELATDLSANPDVVELRGLTLASEAGDIEAEATLQLDGLALDATTELFDIRSTWLSVAGVELPVEQDWGLSGQLRWRGTATDPLAEGNLAIDGQWQGQALSTAVQIDRFDLSQVTLGQSRLQLADTETEVSGVVNWQQQEVDVVARLQALRLNTVRPFLPPLPEQLQTLSGSASGDFRIVGPWAEPAVNADLAFDGRWLEQPLTLQATVSANNRERWNIRQASVNWSELGVSFTGEVQPFAGRIDGNYEITALTLTDVRRLPLTLPESLASLSGTAGASGRVMGDLTAPTLSSELDFAGDFQGTPLSLNVAVSELTTERLTLESLLLQSGDGRLQASGLIGFQPLTVDVDTELTQLDWDQITPWIPETTGLYLATLSGLSSAQVSIEGAWPDLALDGQIQSSGAYLNDAYDLSWQGSGTLGDRLQHEARLTWGEALLELDLENQGEQVAGDVTLSRVSLQRLRNMGLSFNPELSGEINGQASIDGAITNPVVDVEMRAGGDWVGFVVDGNTRERWSVSIVAEGRLDDWQISEIMADLGPGGEISVRGSGTSRSVDLNAEIDIPNIERWLGNGSTLAGSLQGDLQVSGTPDEPAIAADLSWDSHQWPLNLLIDISTEQGQHRLLATLKENQTDRLSLNVSTDQTPLTNWTEPLQQRAFTAEADMAINETVLEPLFRSRPDQDFTGNIDGRLSFVGTLERPEWEGQIELSEGRYENAGSGAVLAGMSASLTANNRTLQFSLAANDTNGGDLSLGGDVNWPEDREVWWMPELDLELDADEARLVRRADVDATIDGSITVIGPWRDLRVEGLLDVSPLIIQLDSLLQSGAPTLNVVQETTREEQEAEAQRQEASAFAPAGNIQVRLRAERRAQIYGAGLAAELSGEVDITGELSDPQIGGRFQVIRGNYTAFSKNFIIERGNIQLQGSQVLLDILAVYEGPDLTVNLNIQGSQERLDLNLTSTPALANDELLARLLFGRSIAEMSALQAVQLAAALNSLRNPTGGLDVFGTTRDALGLDTLTLGSGTNEDGESGVNVSAGKYLSDRIYLEVESGVGAEEGVEGSLQFQLTPRINAELYTRGQFGAGGVELNWKNDY